jgi:hypothetical protein
VISLRPIDSSNYREAIELSVAPDQQHLVASKPETGEVHGGEIVMERQI